MKTSTRIVLIICATTILITIVVLSYLSGEGIELGSALQALGVFVAGLIAAMGFRRGGGALLMVLCLSQSACVQPWVAARGTIGAAKAALDAIEPCIPEDAEGRTEALEITDAALEMGDVVVDMWEERGANDKPLGWWKWAGAAARGFTLILNILKSAGVPIPAPLAMVASAIGALVTT